MFIEDDEIVVEDEVDVTLSDYTQIELEEICDDFFFMIYIHQHFSC